MKHFGYSGLALICSVTLTATACTTQDEQYFNVHPKALQEAIAACPDKAPKYVSCDSLRELAIKVNELVYELRMSPQGFGKSILSLQEKIAAEESGHESVAESVLEKNKAELRERLAVVGWLESPVS